MDLKALLLDLVEVVAEEAQKNPDFQKKLEKVLKDHVLEQSSETPPQLPPQPKQQPSLLDEYQSKGESALKARLMKLKAAECKDLAKENDIPLRNGSKTKKADAIEDILAALRGKASEGGEEPQLPDEGKKEEGKGEEAENIHPVQIYHQDGPEKLRALLEELEAEDLHAIIKQRRLDATGKTKRWKSKEKLIEHIMTTAESRASQGEAFRNYDR